MIEDLFIISDGGSLMFSWHSKGEGASQDDLVGGFLSAIDSFVTSERGEKIKVLKLDPSSIIFEKIEKLNIKFILSTKRLELLDLLGRFLQDFNKILIKIITFIMR